MFKTLIVEIKNAIFKSWFHAVRFLGLLLIPFIYGFSYIYAFYDPFTKTDQLQIVVVTHPNDKFAAQIAESFTKKRKLTIGDLEFETKMTHLYAPKSATSATIKTLAKHNNLTLEFPNHFDQALATNLLDVLKAISDNTDPLDALKVLMKLLEKLRHGAGVLNLYNNYQKSYSLAFGANIISSASATYRLALKALLVSNPTSLLQEMRAIAAAHPQQYPHIAKYLRNFKYWTQLLQEVTNIKFKPLVLYSQMGGVNSKYGYGLAPFFICVALWIGGMVMTFAIHHQRYDLKVSVLKTYGAKYLLIAFANILQATILFTALALIGFQKLGLDHWLMMYLFSIVIALIFSALIQAIRFSIPSRNIGIFVIIILLVLQMGAAGGIFPVSNQNGFFRALHQVVPFKFGVNMIRELMYQTNWGNVFLNFAYLVIFLLYVPLGIFAYKLHINGKGLFLILFGSVEKYEAPHDSSHRGEN